MISKHKVAPPRYCDFELNATYAHDGEGPLHDHRDHDREAHVRLYGHGFSLRHGCGGVRVDVHGCGGEDGCVLYRHAYGHAHGYGHGHDRAYGCAFFY